MTSNKMVRCRRRHKAWRISEDVEDNEIYEKEYFPLAPSCSTAANSSTGFLITSQPPIAVCQKTLVGVESENPRASEDVEGIRIQRRKSNRSSAVEDDDDNNNSIVTMRRRRFAEYGRTRRRMETDSEIDIIEPISCSESMSTSHASSSSSSSPKSHQNYISKFRIRRSPIFSLFLVYLCAILQPCSSLTEHRCGPIDIRNKPGAFRPQWSHLGDPHVYNYYNKSVVDCTVIEGSFTISFVLDAIGVEFTQKDYPRFPKLREITGALLVFETEGLTDLSYMFPELRVIGGQSLIQHYSLIIYRNIHMEKGLDNLKVIRNGGVRIMDNKLLCHMRTINWKSMIMSSVNDVVVDDAAEFAVTETGRLCSKGPCEEDKDETRCQYVEQPVGRVQSCWANTTCVKFCKWDRINNTQFGPGCDPNGEKCHDQCLGGCEKPGDASACYACRNVYHKGRCLEKCDAHLFLLLNRRCVTKEQCLELNPVLSNKTVPIKAVDGLCSDRCPNGWIQDTSDHSKCKKCDGKCEIVCPLNHVIDTFPKALAIRRCNIIEGNLTIEMKGKQESGMAAELKDIFANIHTITGYLNVQRSPVFLTLQMFRNLRRIEAKSLFLDTYAISVVENPNLRKLFDPNLNFTIGAGDVQFHNNKMLCYKQIEHLVEKLGLKINVTHQSSESNGDKAICEDLKIDVTVTMVTHDSIFFQWPAFNTTDIDHRKFLGYELFFKEVDKVDPQMSIEDDRSACVDSWQSVFKQHYERDDGNNEKIIHMDVGTMQRIRPNTIYAYYVATQMVRHPGAKNGVSRIGFVKTKFYMPDPPSMRVAQVETDSILIEWEPPHQANGDITHYMIKWRELDVGISDRAEKFCIDDSAMATSVYTETVELIKEEEKAYEPNSTVAPSFTEAPSIAAMLPTKGTCSAIVGCCSCSAGLDGSSSTERPNPSSALESATFENDLLDAVLSPRKQLRIRRSIENTNRVSEMMDKEEKRKTSATTARSTSAPDMKSVQEPPLKPSKPIKSPNKPLTYVDKKKPKANGSRVIPTTTKSSVKIAVNPKLPFANRNHTNLDYDVQYKLEEGVWAINVTAKPTDNIFVIKGLKHFTRYSINIAACQNLSVAEATCSMLHKSGGFKRTKPLMRIDKVLNETINFKLGNDTQQVVHVTWDSVKEMNGGMFGYMVKIKSKIDGHTVMTRCAGAKKNWSPEKHGVTFQSLADGNYFLAVTAYSAYGEGPEAESTKTITIYTPGFWTLYKILFLIAVIAVFLLAGGIIIYYYIRIHYGKKVKALSDFMQQNPEYCVDNKYTADDWELRQEDVVLGQQCGEGSFGKVFLGTGNNVDSLIGCKFGPCAIKINVDDPSSQENLNYLMEANIMKNFKTNFIVKLYGVISTVQPAMVVMEVMELGNLRDYLRSKREDEVFNEMDCNFFDIIPREKFHEWAAQICDGMAYLESLKFCHRDLAARNCMINRDETVKIGDFGMARDLFYHDYYKPSGKRMMPVRWMSPESLKDGKFDSKSDIWSFGIVLYEMVTLGAQPYIGLSNDEVLNYIGMARKIIKKPECCENYWYKIMRMCWRYSPRDRPTFLQLVHLLAAEASPEFRELSFVLNDNQMILDDCEALDLDEIDDAELNEQPEDKTDHHGNHSDNGDHADYTETPDESQRRNTDSIPMKEFKANLNGVSSISTMSMEEASARQKRQRSLDDEYALMNHSRGPSDTEVRNYGGDGDYVERDVRENDVPTRRNTGASSSSYTGGPYCLSNRGGSNERAGFGEGLRLTDGIGSGHLNDDDYVEKDISSMDTRRSTGASTSSYGVPQTNWSGTKGATYFANKAQAAAQAAAAAQQKAQNAGRGDRLTQLPGTQHLASTRGGADGDYIETEPKNQKGSGSPSRNGNGAANRSNFNARGALGEKERLIEDNEHPLA